MSVSALLQRTVQSLFRATPVRYLKLTGGSLLGRVLGGGAPPYACFRPCLGEGNGFFMTGVIVDLMVVETPAGGISGVISARARARLRSQAWLSPPQEPAKAS